MVMTCHLYIIMNLAFMLDFYYVVHIVNILNWWFKVAWPAYYLLGIYQLWFLLLIIFNDSQLQLWWFEVVQPWLMSKIHKKSTWYRVWTANMKKILNLLFERIIGNNTHGQGWTETPLGPRAKTLNELPSPYYRHLLQYTLKWADGWKVENWIMRLYYNFCKWV